MERRRFIVKAGGVLATAGVAAAVAAPNVIAQPKVQWRMPSAYPPATDVFLGSAQRMAKAVEDMSGGRFRIEVSPAGQIMPPLAIFDAASQGTVEAFQGASLFWATKEPAVPWFTNVPFGLNAAGMAGWLLQGDGLKLWEETYAQFNLVPRPGLRPASRWPAGSKEDQHARRLQGPQDAHPRPRRPGPRQGGRDACYDAGGRDLRRAGARRDRRVRMDRPVRRHEAGPAQHARYYYYPGWHEPGATLEFGFNKKAYEALPVDLQRTLDHATAAVQLRPLGIRGQELIALEKLKTEFKGKVEILPLPTPVLRDLKKMAAEVVKEASEKSPMAKKVYASSTKFQAQLTPGGRASRKAPTISSSPCEPRNAP